MERKARITRRRAPRNSGVAKGESLLMARVEAAARAGRAWGQSAASSAWGVRAGRRGVWHLLLRGSLRCSRSRLSLVGLPEPVRFQIPFGSLFGRRWRQLQRLGDTVPARSCCNSGIWPGLSPGFGGLAPARAPQRWLLIRVIFSSCRLYRVFIVAVYPCL